MNEKIYKTMGRVGGGNIAMGAVLVVVGVATGVLMIVSGAGLLKRRGKLCFKKMPEYFGSACAEEVFRRF